MTIDGIPPQMITLSPQAACVSARVALVMGAGVKHSATSTPDSGKTLSSGAGSPSKWTASHLPRLCSSSENSR